MSTNNNHHDGPKANANAATADLAFEPKDIAQEMETIGVGLEAGPKRTPQSAAAVPGYEILGELGRGGMGVVYRARQVRLGRTVALKMILAGSHAGAVHLARFRTEALAVAQLQHPNIVQIYEVGEHDGLPYFSLEFCPGGSLDRKLGGVPLAPLKAAEFTETLARAIHAAHERHIVHRDLKPGNILLQQADDGKNGEKRDSTFSSFPLHSSSLKITDFGLAKNLRAAEPGSDSDVTQSGTVIGTPSYMAPEQASGQARNIGPSADIYALGAMLYEFLTGRPPFRAETPVDTIMQVLTQDPAPPSRLNSKTPRDLETICLKCLQKEPERRYLSAADLAEDLRRFQAGESIQARPMGALERGWRWVKRYPAKASLIAALLLMLLGGGAAAFWYQGERARQGSETEQRSLYLNKEVALAVADAEKKRKSLYDRLADPKLVHELLSDTAEWDFILASAEADWKRADSQASGALSLLDADLLARLQRLKADLTLDRQHWKFARAFDDARFVWLDRNYAMTESAKFASFQAMARGYVEAFSLTDFDMEHGDLATIVRQMKDSPMRLVYVAAIDDWATVTYAKDALLDRLLAVANELDADPWRRAFRNPATWYDPPKLLELTEKMKVKEQTPQIVRSLARILGSSRVKSYAAAENLVRQARDAFPRDFWLAMLLGQHSQDPREKEACFHAALILRPREPAVHVHIGSVLEERHDFDGAIGHFREAVRLNENLALAHAFLGGGLHNRGKKGDLEEALACCRKALELKSDSSFALNNLALVLEKRGDVQEAVKVWETAMKLDQNSALVRVNLGRHRPPDEAKKLYLEAIAMDPGVRNGQRNLGLLCLENKDIQGAIEHFGAAVNLQPNHAAAHYNLGIALNMNNEPGKAMSHFLKVVELEPGHVAAHVHMGAIYDAKKRWDEAVKHCRKSLEADPKNGMIHGNLATALRHKKDLPAAVHHFRKAVEYDPDAFDRYADLADTLTDAGEFAAAREAWQICLKTRYRFPERCEKQLKRLELLIDNDNEVVAIMNGEQPMPTDISLLLHRAELSRRLTRRYVAAVRLNENALKIRPELVNERQHDVRHRAARSAVLAAAGKGRDVAGLGPKEKAEFRRRALDWLRADLAQLRDQVQSDSRAAVFISDRLTGWQKGAELASVRELAALPGEERADWQKFWSDVDAALKEWDSRFAVVKIQSSLTDKAYVQVHEVKLLAGKDYVVDQQSGQFNSLLKLTDEDGKVLTWNDDVGADNVDARVEFSPPRTGAFRIVAGSFHEGDTGTYSLTIREFASAKK